MASYYSQNHGATILNDRLRKFRDLDDELSCRDELAVQRSVLFDRMGQYSTALETGNSGQVALAGEMAAEHARHIVKSVDTISKTEKIRTESITPEMMHFMASQLFGLAYEMFGDHENTTEFVSQAEVILNSAGSMQDVSEDDLIACMGMAVPMAELTENPE